MTRSEKFADGLWDELGLLHTGLEMTRGDWIRAIAPALDKFANAIPNAVGVYSREDCPFKYCDTEAPHLECRNKCRHVRKFPDPSVAAADPIAPKKFEDYTKEEIMAAAKEFSDIERARRQEADPMEKGSAAVYANSVFESLKSTPNDGTDSANNPPTAECPIATRLQEIARRPKCQIRVINDEEFLVYPITQIPLAQFQRGAVHAYEELETYAAGLLKLVDELQKRKSDLDPS